MQHELAVINLLGGALFLVATGISIRNYRYTRSISNYWLIFSIAMFLGATKAFITAIDLLYAAPTIDRYVLPISVAFGTVLVLTAIESLTTRIQHTIK